MCKYGAEKKKYLIGFKISTQVCSTYKIFDLGFYFLIIFIYEKDYSALFKKIDDEYDFWGIFFFSNSFVLP